MKSRTYTLARSGVVMIPQGDALFPGLTSGRTSTPGRFQRGRGGGGALGASS